MDQFQVPISYLAQGDFSLSIDSYQVEEDLSASENLKLLSSILGWFYPTPPADRLHVQAKYYVLKKVVDQLCSLGLKLRFDWDFKSSTAVIRLPTFLYDIPDVWFYQIAIACINKAIGERAICGKPVMDVRGPVTVAFGPWTTAGGSTLQLMPDESLDLYQTYEGGKQALVEGSPRIVLEISASESRQYIIDKTFKWLHEMDHEVHAVVICVFTNTPSRVDEPGSDTKPFKAEIAVWVRPESGNLNVDYPCDECYGGGRHTTRGPELTTGKASGALGQESSNDARESDLNTMDSDPDPEETSTNPNNSQFYDSPFDPLAREYSRPDPENPHRKQWIRRRSPSWIVVYDESIPAGQEEPEPELLLDVYDVLRPCSKFPGDWIANRAIPIPLGALRESLAQRVQNMREQSSQTKRL